MNLFEKNNGKLFPEVEKKSLDVAQEKIEKLKELFPNIVSDGKIDWNTLKVMLGENITEEEERYRFTWVGKNKAIQEPNIPTTSTLRPDKDSSKNWDTTENLYIEGDNLEVLKILQNSYNGKIKMIYIDPPYNTGSDFIYKDDFTLTMEEVEKQEGLRDKKGATKTVDRLTKNTKDSAKYHTNWLNMMYPRLSIARDLLADDGIICISLDDYEEKNLTNICDEIFGEANKLQKVIWQRHAGGGNDSKYFAVDHEYILVYAKNKSFIDKIRVPLEDEDIKEYKLKDEYFSTLGPFKTKDFRRMRPDDPRENLRYKIITPDGTILFDEWRWEEEKFKREYQNNKVLIEKNTKGEWNVKYKLYLKSSDVDEEKQKVPRSLLIKGEKNSQGKKILGELLEEKDIFNNPKPVGLLKYLLSFRDKNSLILDFFSGSATTAHAVMQLNAEDGGNRKFIMVQVPELSYDGKKDKNGEYIIDEKTGLPEIQKDSKAREAGFNLITEIGKKRIRRAGEKILEDNKDKDLSSLDIGFKTFKVDSSNFNEWDISYEAMVKAVKDSAEGKYTTYKQDRSELDLVYEIMLKEGLQLTEEVEEIDFEGITIYKIANGVIYIFLGKLTKEIVDKIIEMKKEVQELFGLDNPTVILNETYLDSEIKANAKENFISNGIVNIKTL